MEYLLQCQRKGLVQRMYMPHPEAFLAAPQTIESLDLATSVNSGSGNLSVPLEQLLSGRTRGEPSLLGPISKPDVHFFQAGRIALGADSPPWNSSLSIGFMSQGHRWQGRQVGLLGVPVRFQGLEEQAAHRRLCISERRQL